MAFYQRLNPRLFVLSGILALLFAVLIGGLAWQQLWKSSDYDRQERRQTLRRILQPGPRGRILDRNGVPLVVNQPHYSVVLYVDELRKEFNDKFDELRKDWLAHANDDTTEVHPTMDRNKLYQEARVAVAHRYLDQANALLGRTSILDERAFELHVEDKPLLPFILIPDISATDFARFNEELPVESHMQTRVETRRYYPYGSLAFHTLGWVGMTSEYDEEDWPIEDLPKYSTFPYRGMTGLHGLEYLHDDILSGKSGGEIWVVDPAASRIEKVAAKTPQSGQDFVCSLDVNLQQVAENAIQHTEDVLCGSAVALDVRTGEVLVLASTPDFDLNETVPVFSEQLNNDLATIPGAWLNRAVQGLYPPGSTFKLVTTIAAMRAGVINSTTLLDCPGEISIGGRMFKDDTYDKLPEGRGKIDVVTALEKSSDVFYYQVGTKLGWAPLNKEARDFGFGQQTGIGLHEPATHELIVPDPETKKSRHNEGWNPGDDANFAIGQSDLQLTPLQMACFVASIARDETRTQPTLVHQNLSPDTVIHGGKPIGLSLELRQSLLDGMEKVVSDDGTGYKVVIPGMRIAGKTGTAQWGPHKNTTVAWFVCFAPIENPRIAIAVALESSHFGSDIYGGQVAGPVARQILEEYFKRYPDSIKPTDAQTSANP